MRERERTAPTLPTLLSLSWKLWQFYLPNKRCKKASTPCTCLFTFKFLSPFSWCQNIKSCTRHLTLWCPCFRESLTPTNSNGDSLRHSPFAHANHSLWQDFVTLPEWDTGVWVPGAFKLDHLQPLKQILFPKFFNLYIFILGSPILITPERGRLKMGKWNYPNLSETQGFECLGHSNWTICSLISQFCSLNFPTSTS